MAQGHSCLNGHPVAGRQKSSAHHTHRPVDGSARGDLEAVATAHHMMSVLEYLIIFKFSIKTGECEANAAFSLDQNRAVHIVAVILS